ncbi:MAG: hypothetical protein U5K79_07130 [Cyclobacteriaceae bacterium]|nr:hypothetical protein [Cyclobacteriaceae bacterium]
MQNSILEISILSEHSYCKAEMMNSTPDNPYLLLTPGPLSTTASVRGAMMKDWCTWDKEYNAFIQIIRAKLVGIATNDTDNYTAVLMQGSGTFSVEAAIGTSRTGLWGNYQILCSTARMGIG